MKTTFIIPVKIESHDRARNLKITIEYLLRNSTGNIIIKEADRQSIVPTIIGEKIKNNRIHYLYEATTSAAFHRTKYLNDMLELVDTEIVSNYDVDVLLPPSAYTESENLILENVCDVVYPYPKSEDGQYMLFLQEESETRLILNPSYENVMSIEKRTCPAYAGHCFFIRAKSYKSSGGEIEEFISYGPEDGERISRFSILGLRINRLQSKVMHMEHVRTHDSNMSNPYFKSNCTLEKLMLSLNKEQMLDYIRHLPYMKSRNWL